MLLFESFKQIEVLCQKYDIRNYTINKDGTIDVDGSVYLERLGLTELPLKFREVTGGFWCVQNELTTLEGAPQSIGGDFICYKNNLHTLEGAPKLVGGSFYCFENNLHTLEGAPKSIGGAFYCNNNPLDSIRELFPDDKTFYKSCMEWEFFAGDNKIYKHRFLEAMLDIGQELPESIPGYEYI